MLQTLVIVAELEGARHSLATLAKIGLDTSTLLSTAQHVPSGSNVHA